MVRGTTGTTPDAEGRPVVRWVTHGASAVEVLRSTIADAKAGDPLQPVTVVVPTKVSGLGLRRALASRPGGTVGVGFVVLDQLAEQLAATRLAASGRRPLTPLVRTEVVREALRRQSGGLGSLATHPATVHVVEDAFTTIREATAADGEDAHLEDLRALGGLQATLVDAFRTFRELTAPTRYDEHDLALLAADAVADLDDEVGPVVLHLPTRVTPAGTRLVRSLARVAPVSVLLGRTGDERADAVTAAVGSRLTGTDVTPPAGGAPDRADVDAVVVPDAEEEVREAARLVTSALHAGQDLARIAVLYTAARPYATLVHELFDAADLPHNGPTERLVRQTLAGRVLDELWGWAEQGTPRSELFDVLGSVPVRWEGRRVPADRWDRVARQARVLGGPSHWDDRLAGFAATCDRQRASEGRDWLRDRLERDRDLALELRRFVLELTDVLAPPRPATWTAWSRWALHLLDVTLGTGRSGWPATDVDAEGDLRQQLTSLAQLDEVRADLGLAEREVSSEEARGAIATMLDQPAGRVGRAGVGVYVGPLGTAGTLDHDHVVVLGAVEGQLPPSVRGNVLLPDEGDATAGVASSHERVDAVRQALHRVLAGTRRATFTVPRADRREQRARVPAPWLLDLLSEGAGRRVGVAEVLGDGAAPDAVRVVASRLAGLRDAPTAAGVEEHRLRLLTAHLDGGGDLADANLVRDTPVLAHGVAVTRHRRGADLTAFDGHVDGAEEALRDRIERPHSPATLSDYATCPRRYLFAHVLRVRPEEEPRRWLDVDALDRGTLVHDTLERWVAETLDEHAGTPAGASAPGTEERLLELLEDGFAELEATGRIGLSALWDLEKGRLRKRLRVWLEQDTRLREQHGVTPVAVEEPFGLGHGDAALRVDTAAGITLSLRGQIDRIDAAPDGQRVVVTDYKTSAPSRYTKLKDDIAQGGAELQLPVYGLAAARRHPDAEVHVGYWHVHDDVTAGTQPTLLAFDAAARARTQEVLDTIARGVTDGVFVGVPGPETLWPRPTFDHCTYCPFDSICPSHAERARAGARDVASEPAQVLWPLWESAIDDDGEVAS